jgi:hypothetical protein
MSIEGFRVIDKTFVAGADLSSSRFKFVKLSAGKIIECAAATDRPIGVLQDSPKSGFPGAVRVIGETKVQADAALTVGTLIGTSSDAQADAKVPGTDTTEYVCGFITVAAGAAAGLASALINCVNPARGA